MSKQLSEDEKIDEILQTLAAEAFIFGNFALGKATSVPLPDDNHELPPVEKAKQALKSLIADREREAIENYIAPFIKGCEEQNGLPYCKNCGLTNLEVNHE